MRERIIYLLKHNEIVQRIYRVVFSTLFKFIGLFVKTDEKLVVFLSFMGTKFNDSPKVIYDYIKAHHEYDKLKCVWVFVHPEDYPELDTVKIDTLRFFLTALKAKYWISNTQFERGLSFKKKATRYLYTAHGAGFKLCGNSAPGRHDFDYSSVNVLCVESEYEKMIFRSSFNAREESFLACGRPYSDALWNATEEEKQRIKERLNLPNDKKVILYAPTWRDSTNSGASYDLAPPIHFDLWEKELRDEYIVLFRAHHITTKILGVQFNDFVVNVSDYNDVNDLMIVSDILISDYSSMITDYAILEKPIISFAYDYDTYIKEKGTYIDLEEKLPNGICRTEEEVLGQIRRMDFHAEEKKAKLFKKQFNQYGGNAVQESVKALFKDI